MARDSVKRFLQNLVKEELKDNLLANVFAIYWDTNNLNVIKDVFDQLVPLMVRHKEFKDFDNLEFENKVKKETEYTGEKDLRIKAIRLSNIRGVGEKGDGNHFGIDFVKEKDGEPFNAVILGANGSGKTSVFSAIEHIYAENIGEADLRYENPNYRDYLKHINDNINPEFTEIKMENDSYLLDKPLFSINNFKINANPTASFVSDYDIYYNGRLDFTEEGEEKKSIHWHIARLLGFEEYHKLSPKFLKSLILSKKTAMLCVRTHT